MDVGKGCIISDKWIPKGKSTGLTDINGNEIKTSNIVQLNGCSSSYAIVGLNTDNQTLMLFFGSERGSVGWHLNQERVNKNKVRIIKECAYEDK